MRVECGCHAKALRKGNVFNPGGVIVNSQGRKPLELDEMEMQNPGGVTED